MNKGKILFYIDVFKNQGGAQRVMSNLIGHFLAKGYELVLVTDIDDGSECYDCFSKTHFKKYTLLNKVEKLGFFRRNLRKIRSLRKIIKNEKPLICLSFLGGPNLRLLFSCLFKKIKCIVSVRSDPNVEYGNSFPKRFFTNVVFKKAAGIVLQTEYVKQYFWKANRKRCIVITNPVADSFYNIARNSVQSNIVTFGSLIECKNHKMLIDAFALSQDVFANDCLFIYGQGPLKSELEMYVEKLGLKEKVFFPGNVKNVGEILSQAKMFVLTSNYEGLPNALMEAMATGTPCISTDCPSGGPRSLIRNDHEGILVPCNNPLELSFAMKKINRNDVRAEMSIQEKKRALSFKGQIVFKKWESYLLQFVK